MHKFRIYLINLILCLLSVITVFSQEVTGRLETIEVKLNMLAITDPRYLDQIDLSISSMPIHELIRHVAQVANVNISVTADTNMSISCNFSRTRIKDLILFLCKEYDLQVEVVGNIVSLFPFDKRNHRSTVTIDYSPEDSTTNMDFSNVPLYEVCREISEKTEFNVLITKDLYDYPVSVYLKGMSFKKALYSLASSNGLVIDTSNGVYTLMKLDIIPENQSFRNIVKSPPEQNNIIVDSLGLYNIIITNGNINDVILEVCRIAKINYKIVNEINAPITIHLKKVNLNTLLSTILTGSTYSYFTHDNIYFFGKPSKEDPLLTTKIISFKNRSADNVLALIPTDTKNKVELIVFPELNSIIVSGDHSNVSIVETFLEQIDRKIPLVTIDIMIVEVSKKKAMETGINLGIGENPVKTTGRLSPGIDMTLDASNVNKILNSFKGFGNVNLGKVPDDFFATIKFLEETGNIRLESTPRLSTLNGFEATLSSGEKQYYKEINNSYVGSQNPLPISSYIWKDLEANLSVIITPFVSTDNKITMNIKISQSEFTERVEEDAPPGITTRSFKSIVIVNDGEAVLLGGIEKRLSHKSSSGLPFFARIPILKWLTGNTNKISDEHLLNVFIRPSIIN